MKKYQVILTNKGMMLAWNGHAVLQDITLEISLTRHQHFFAMPLSVATEKGKTEVLFDGHGKMERLALVLREESDVLCISLDAEIRNFYDLYANETFLPEDAVKLHFAAAEQPKGVLATSIVAPWWQTPSFLSDIATLPRTTQSVLVKTSFGAHMLLQPLVASACRTEMEGDALLISSGVSGQKKLNGTILSVSLATDPYRAIFETFTCQKKLGGLRVPLRAERHYPEIFEYFGWCTWNACYHDVTSTKIFEKLDELREKGVRVGWVLIDDGWSQYTSENKLTSFYEDRTKFPEGLKETVRRIKEEYGVRYVGVWHAFTGYWNGIEKDSELYRMQKDNLMQTAAGWIIPSVRGERAFRFWDAWHSYLAEQGIDFVKVDNQASLSTKLDGEVPTAEGVRLMHAALERSVNKNFGGAIINCMGMNNENIFNRPTSALNRNSDDFFPERANGFRAHIYQNAYCAPVHSCIHHCDYDMWWSEHESALESSVLRAISGGPIYVSDEIGKTDVTYIKPLMDENARIFRPDEAARPTYDCLYVDCAAAGLPLKLFNVSGNNLVVAAFGLNECENEGTLRLADIPSAVGDYLAVNYFTGERLRMTGDTVVNFALKRGEVALWNLYPIVDGKTFIGDTKPYMGCATEITEEVAL